MTFVLITSSGTMAMAVKFGYEKRKVPTFWLLMVTARCSAPPSSACRLSSGPS